jgi:hypothetical protein
MTRLCLCLILSFVALALADDPPMPFTGKVVKADKGDRTSRFFRSDLQKATDPVAFSLLV